jgi:DNA-3-methyladenine glycosylase
VKPLPRAFYARSTALVARELVGKLLVRNGRPARIVEVEAYLGEKDLASHARFGPTARSSIMFGPPGRLYVYLIYGMHHCMNVVTERDGVAGAVLLRAAAWEGGDPKALSGPGKLCKGLGITRLQNGLDLTDPREGFFLAEDAEPRRPVSRSPRIGVDYAGSWAPRPLRFYRRAHPAVSARPR